MSQQERTDIQQQFIAAVDVVVRLEQEISDARWEDRPTGSLIIRWIKARANAKYLRQELGI